MKARTVAFSVLLLLVVGLVYGRLQNALIGKITANDHPILKILDARHEISNTEDVFRGVVEVCIVNKVNINEQGKRNCNTSGEVLALLNGDSCEIISLEKLPARVLFSENTSECRKTSERFRIKFHKQFDSTEVLDFD